MEKSDLKLWAEVHYEVVQAITLALSNGTARELQDSIDARGFQEAYHEAFRLTNEFIALPETDEEFWEKIENFMKAELAEMNYSDNQN